MIASTMQWRHAKADDGLLLEQCFACIRPFADDDLVTIGIHPTGVYVALHQSCNAGDHILITKESA